MTSDSKLGIGDGAAPAPGTPTVNAMDALNRRDIEMIKRLLVTLQKDNAELRNTIVALHGRNARTPSKGFFVGLAVITLALAALLTVGRPHLGASLANVPGTAPVSRGAAAS